jgi:hypothetical protein
LNFKPFQPFKIEPQSFPPFKIEPPNFKNIAAIPFNRPKSTFLLNYTAKILFSLFTTASDSTTPPVATAEIPGTAIEFYCFRPSHVYPHRIVKSSSFTKPSVIKSPPPFSLQTSSLFISIPQQLHSL